MENQKKLLMEIIQIQQDDEEEFEESHVTANIENISSRMEELEDLIVSVLAKKTDGEGEGTVQNSEEEFGDFQGL